MAISAQNLADESACYVCAGANIAQAFELALLARIATASVIVLVPTSYRVTPSTTSPPAGSVVPITAQLLDQFGNALSLAGRVVTWSKTGVGGSFDFATSTTNASGIATVNFTVNTLANENQRVTGTDAGGITGTTAIMKIVAAAASKYLVTSGNYTPVPQQVVTISAQLTDQYNNTVSTAGIVVTWSKTGAGGSFATATSNTDAGGLATVAFTTGSTNGTVYVVTGTDTGALTGSTTNITLTLSAQNSDWLARIIAAGGVQPSANTFVANDVYYAALVAAGLTAKLGFANTFAPDSLIACITPFIKGNGLDTWSNSNFVNGDLTINGLIGNGSNKALNTNSSPFPYTTAGSGHLCVYISLDDVTVGSQCDVGVGLAGPFRQFSHGNTLGTTFSNINNFINCNITVGSIAGYLCSSRTTTTRFDAYWANSGVAHSSVFNDTTLNPGTPSTNPLLVFASNEGASSFFTKKRLSYVSMGGGLSAAESLAHFNAVQALRVAYGGGFI